MKTQVHKWGNSLALRIPKSMADKIGLADASPVEVALVKGRIVLEPAKVRHQFDLKEMLSRVTEANRHGEADSGGPVGKETW